MCIRGEKPAKETRFCRIVIRIDTDKKNHPRHWQCFAKATCRQNAKKKATSRRFARFYSRPFPQSKFPSVSIREIRGFSSIEFSINVLWMSMGKNLLEKQDSDGL